MSIHPIVNYFVHQGVPLETVKLIFILPVIATLIAFFRQVIGIKAFGIYTPLIITFAFLATKGIKYGIAIFVAVLVVGMAMRYVLRPFKLLYLPRVAIMLSVVAISILLMLTFGGSLKRTGLAEVSIFPILIMITLVEKFVAAQIEKGNRTALFLASVTLIISIIGYYLMSWKAFGEIILAYPWQALLVVVLINIFLGKWTGLRLSEYWRFKEILKKM